MVQIRRRKVGPPFSDLEIATSERGFYTGFSKHVTVTSKIIVATLIVWAIAFPAIAGEWLGLANTTLIRLFANWYVYLIAAFVLLALLIALLPVSGKLKLGYEDDKPEFSRLSWFAMMFGAGLGIGMLTYSTGEPLSHLQNNPQIIAGDVAAVTPEAVQSAYLYSFLHWGFSAWAIYALVGLAVAYVSYRRALPLTIRSALTPLVGRWLSGLPGHAIDIVAVVATILGISVTLGLGVEQFVQGLARLGVGDWLINDAGTASDVAIVVALLVIVGASTLSALSGVGKGIKWLSNLNLGLSFLLFAAFLTTGATLFSVQVFGEGLFHYLVSLPGLLFMSTATDGTQTANAVLQWQLDWTVFYWAWWIAFAPFVGMFIARVSKGRTLREYILGVVLAPSIMCFVWLSLIGGTAVDLAVTGADGGRILDSVISDQLYATLAAMMSPTMAYVFSLVVVLLLLTYVVTSADSAILIVNTINAGGNDVEHGRRHILFWAIAIAFVVGSLLLVGGLDAIRTAMIIGALPFSFVCAAMMVALVKAIWFDMRRAHHGVPTTVPAPPPDRRAARRPAKPQSLPRGSISKAAGVDGLP